jgi:Putative Ig domain
MRTKRLGLVIGIGVALLVAVPVIVNKNSEDKSTVKRPVNVARLTGTPTDEIRSYKWDGVGPVPQSRLLKPAKKVRSVLGTATASPNYIGLPLLPESRGRMQATGHSDVDIVFTATSTASLTSFATEFISNGNYSSHPNANYVQGASNNCNGTTNNEDGSGVCAGAYSSGHGGTIQLDIYADDPVTHNPTGASLGHHTWVTPMIGSANASNPNGRGFFTQPGNDQGSWQGPLALTPQPSVTAGSRYHAVYTNPHPNAEQNWYGINFIESRGTKRRNATQDVVSKLDFDARFRGRPGLSGTHNTGNVWRSCTKNEVFSGGTGDDCWGSSEQITALPVFYALYSNGDSSGNGYELNLPNYWIPPSYFSVPGDHVDYRGWGPSADGTSSVRQTITVPGATQVTEIGASIIPMHGSGPGSGSLNLRRTSDEALIAGFSFSYPSNPGLPGGLFEGANAIELKGAVGPTALPAGQYYIEFVATSGDYYPVILQPFMHLSEVYFTATGLGSANVQPDWPTGSRYEGGVVQFRNTPGSTWYTNAPADALAYIRTTAIVVGPLAPLTATVDLPLNGATGVASSSNATAMTTTDPTCTVTPVTFWIDGVQANVKTTFPWFTFPFNTAANPPFKTSPAITSGTHTIYAVATDSCGRTVTSPTNTFTLAAVNNPPVFTSAASRAVTVGTTPTPVVATDTDTPITYTVTAGALPTGLTLTSTGTFTGAATTAGTFNATVTATDSLGAASTQVVTFTVTAANTPPVFTSSAIRSIATGTAPSAVVATDLNTPITYTVTAGALPAGLTLSTTGSFTGTASTAGTFNATVTATDSLGAASTQAITFTVTAANTPPVFTSSAIRSIATGTAPSAVVATDPNTPITYSVTAGALPTGLSLASTGSFTGTASTAGTFNATVIATDSLGAASTQAITFTVTTATVASVSGLSLVALPASGTGTVGTYTAVPSGATFALSGAQLPAGVTIGATTGIVTALNVPPGIYAFQVNANGLQKTVTIVIPSSNTSVTKGCVRGLITGSQCTPTTTKKA